MKSTSKYHVPANLLLAAKNEMNSILERMNLQRGQINQQPTGNRNLVNSSKAQYLTHYRGLRYFCCLIGDYESLLILQDNPPQPFVPAIDKRTLVKFISWKRGKKGTALMCDFIN
jgi:hypothetical protein